MCTTQLRSVMSHAEWDPLHPAPPLRRSDKEQDRRRDMVARLRTHAQQLGKLVQTRKAVLKEPGGAAATGAHQPRETLETAERDELGLLVLQRQIIQGARVCTGMRSQTTGELMRVVSVPTCVLHFPRPRTHRARRAAGRLGAGGHEHAAHCTRRERGAGLAHSLAGKAGLNSAP